MSKMKRFPILSAKEASLPWALAERFRDQAEKNHSQTLEQLADRGGLSWSEIALAAMGVGLFDSGVKFGSSKN